MLRFPNMAFLFDSLFLTSIASLGLGIFVFLKGNKKLPNITLALLSVSIALWCFAQFVGGLLVDKGFILLWTRFGIAAACFIPVFFLHFILSLIDRARKEGKLIFFVYLLGFVFLGLDSTKLFVADVALTPDYGYYPQAGLVYPFFAVFIFGIFIFSFVRLVFGLWQSTGEKKNQLFYVFIACLISFLGGITTFFPIWHVNFPILTHYVLPVYIYITVYAIVKHKLLEISVIIREGLIYTTLTLLFAGFYVLTVLFANSFMQSSGFIGPFFSNLIVVFISVLVFLPLRDRVQKLVDRIFYRGEYRYQKTIDNLSAENRRLFQSLLRADKLTALGTLAAGMAHEIKNPLASIKGMTQVLEENLNDPVFIAKYQEVIERQINRLNGIVEKLLKFGQPQKLAITRVNLKGIIEDVLSLLENQINKSDIKVEQKLLSELEIEGDAGELAQVFMNLFLNAVQAMPEGGRLLIAAVLQGPRVDIEVTDSGGGIAPQNLGKIFDPFFTTKGDGTGMGLAVAYRIIKEHNGEILVESKQGLGTTFKIWLPIKLVPLA
ncbi:MAG: ATP-binding protein [bacterium]|nr:hypothetical protein [Candidatus Margulisiibacteriota bacterium]